MNISRYPKTDAIFLFRKKKYSIKQYIADCEKIKENLAGQVSLCMAGVMIDNINVLDDPELQQKYVQAGGGKKFLDVPNGKFYDCNYDENNFLFIVADEIFMDPSIKYIETKQKFVVQNSKTEIANIVEQTWLKSLFSPLIGSNAKQNYWISKGSLIGSQTAYNTELKKYYKELYSAIKRMQMSSQTQVMIK